MFKTQLCRDLFASITAEQKNLWKWMLWCTEIPRGSGNCGLIKEALIEVAKQLNLPYETDKVGNVKICKKATAGYENSPAVCIQAHMDMVIEHNPKIRPMYNPLTDPIEPYIENGWLKAKGTTLGADNGIGIAMALAALEDNTLEHPALECFFTVDEETTMEGVSEMDPKFLGEKVQFLINIDSEEEGKLCLGCAGGASVSFEIPVTRQAKPASHDLLSVHLHGLTGGHTGCDSHKGRANAIKTLTKFVTFARREVKSVLLVSMEAGSARNAIPPAATFVLSVPKLQMELFEKRVEAALAVFKEEYKKVEPVDKVTVTFTRSPMPDMIYIPVDAASTTRVFNFWSLAPSQPLRMSPDMPGFVESSCAITIARFGQYAPVLEARGLARTSRASQWETVEQELESLASLCGAKLLVEDKFPGWTPAPESPLAKASIEAYTKVCNGKNCEVYSVHAGLECGYIIEKVPRLQAVSIGPEVNGAHTPEERCLISSGDSTYAWLRQILKDMKIQTTPP